MDQKKIRLILAASAIFFAVLAIILFVFGITYDKGVFAKILLFVISLLVLLLSLELAYLFMLSREVVPNYFLFNSSLNVNIPVNKLTFEMIDAKMNKYFSSFAQSEAKMWTEGVLEKNVAAIKSEFRPIVAYKLLFDIAENDSENAWKCFVIASDRTVEYIAAGVAQNGDKQMASALCQLKAAKPINMKQTRDFLVSNKQYIKKKLYKYVVDNIDKF